MMICCEFENLEKLGFRVLDLSSSLFFEIPCDRVEFVSIIDGFTLELQGTSSMMMITPVITESLLNPKMFLVNCKLLILILRNWC
jgi:hypothetical protein